MDKKEKVKFPIVTILISMLIILGIGTLSWAISQNVDDINMGKDYGLNYNDLDQKTVFCIQHQQSLKGGEKRNYKVVNKIKIVGDILAKEF